MLINSYNMSYEWYLCETAMEEAKLLAHTQECILIAEGKNDYQHMKVVHETVSETLKNTYKKVIDAFAKIWAKFVEMTRSLFNSNLTYLNTYKETIIKKPAPEGRKWTMFNWPAGQKTLISTAIPNFNYESMKSNMEDELTFCKAYFPHLIPADAKEANIEQYALKAFRGGLEEEKETLESTLNMTDIFNYCVTYENIISNLKKDVANVKKASSDCETNINRAEAEGKMKKPESQPQQQQPAAEPDKDKPKPGNPPPSGSGSSGNAGNSGNGSSTNEDTDYSYLFEQDGYKSFVYEGFVLEFGQDNNNKTATTNGDPNNPSKSMQKFDKSKNTGDINAEENTYDDAVARINVYNKCCTSVASAKMTTAETIYKQYMAIIKAKVKYYAGDKTTPNTGAAASTNQNVNTNQQAANTGVDVKGTANQL